MSSDFNNSEIEEIIEYIGQRLSSCDRVIRNLTLKDVTELKVFKLIPDSILVVFNAISISINIDENNESSNLVKTWIKRPQELIAIIREFDMIRRPLSALQVENIRSLYANYSNLTESLKKISILAYALSFWVETYIDITEKYMRVLEIQVDNKNSIGS